MSTKRFDGRQLREETAIYFKFVQRNQMTEVKQVVDSLKSTVEFEDINVVDYLRVKKSGDTALHICAKNGYGDLIRYLIEDEKANVEQINLDGKTALHDAAQFCQPGVLKYLLLKGANVNVVKRADWTPLMLACTKQDVEVVKALVSNGADLGFVNKDGWTCLHLAAREGNVQILDTLLKSCNCEAENAVSSGQLKERKSRNGRKAIHIAVMHGHLDVVKLIASTSTPFELEEEDSCGSTPLMDACRSGHLNIIKFLIDVIGIDPNKQNKNGVGLLHVAAEANQEYVVKTLAEDYHMNVNSPSHLFSFTPLHWASREGNLATVKTLLRLGSDAGTKDTKGRSAADIAVEYKRQEVQAFLQETS